MKLLYDMYGFSVQGCKGAHLEGRGQGLHQRARQECSALEEKKYGVLQCCLWCQQVLHDLVVCFE